MTKDFHSVLSMETLDELYHWFLRSEGIATDTRKKITNKVFFALKGERYNANDFLEEAAQKKPLALVGERRDFKTEIPYFYVENSLKTLQLLAHHHRKKTKTFLIAVGGSNGKTTTKEILYRIFSLQRKTFKTPGNYNNHIGVPLSILQMSASHKTAILEFGDNRPKDLECLCEIASPDMALLTNVGKDHIGNFGSMEKNYQTKIELTDFIQKKGGKLVLPFDDEILRKRYSSYENAWFFGTSPQADASVKMLSPQKNQMEIHIGNKIYGISPRLVGLHNGLNIAASLLTYSLSGFSITEDVLKNIENLSPYSNRGELLQKNNLHIFLDAYNANPSSVQAMLKHWFSVEKNIGVILGEMAELGKFSEAEHKELGKLLAKYAPKFAVLVGEEMLPAYKELQKTKISVYHFKDISELPAKLLQTLRNKAPLWLVKGSRKNRLEKIMEKL